MSQAAKTWRVATAIVAFFIVVFSGSAMFFWHLLSMAEQARIFQIFEQHFVYIAGAVLLVFTGFVLALYRILTNYILPVHRLVEETNLMESVNPDHRITSQGGRQVKQLTQIINEWGERFSVLQKNVQQEISVSKAEVEREKNILAAFVGELLEGVLICNAEGRILFYNRRARELFSEKGHTIVDRDPPDDIPGLSPIIANETLVGLGRSIFNIIDKNLIVHALDEIECNLNQKEVGLTSNFVFATKGGKLLRIEAVPVLDSPQQLTGFVFIASDITEGLQRDLRTGIMLQSLTKNIRASVGGIQSAIETVLAFPDMDSVQLNRFRNIIHNESLTLGKMADKALIDYPDHIQTQWPLVPVLARDLVDMVRRKAEDTLDISIHIDSAVEDCWIEVESYCAILILLFVLNKLKKETGSSTFTCNLAEKDKFVNIDMLWPGKPILIKTLRKWDEQLLRVKKEGLPLTLKEVVGHHGASIWSYSSKEIKNRSCLRLIFPASQSRKDKIVKNITILTEKSRPVFYDFDLFDRQGQNKSLDNRPLAELEYTVFDTETTGLQPRDGDEIISISAVRVVNRHLLQEELFDQFVNPQRSIPIESIKIHGIRPEMLKGQPTIERVLPLFYHFCEDTVLVAHNAAFDMLFLEMNEESSGIKFIHPVLDTLLLADVLHPAQEKHNFQAIADLFGVRIVGRHTSLGDALATAEIFIKMIPLLAKMGIHTLKDAIAASQKSRYARLKF